MRKAIFLNIPLLLLLVSIITTSIYAHPGNTASDGCHYCRTNCDKWGEAWDERHCHGGGSSDIEYEAAPPTQQYVPVIQPTSVTLPTTLPTQEPIPTVVPTKEETSTPIQTNSPFPTPTNEPEVLGENTQEPPTTAETTVVLGILGGMGYGAIWLGKKVLANLFS